MLSWWAAFMGGATRERWMQLAELAVYEQDPDRLVALVQAINTLQEKEAHSKPGAE